MVGAPAYRGLGTTLTRPFALLWLVWVTIHERGKGVFAVHG